MRRALLLTATMLYGPAAFAASAPCSSSAPNFKTGTGTFENLGGKFYTPDGTVFVPRGVNVLPYLFNTAASTLTRQFPGLNFVRVPIYADPSTGKYPDPATFAPGVQTLTAQGVVVLFEDHTTSTGKNAGGGNCCGNQVFTGQQLANEDQFYTSFGQYYRMNPYVWGASNNEPPDRDLNALAQWQQQNYNDWRGSGTTANNNPFLFEASGYNAATFNAGLPQALYDKDRNTGIDLHQYSNNFSNGQTIAENVAGAQRLRSADGIMPVLVGEYGNSQDGTNIDGNAATVIQQVQAAAANLGVGSAAWMYSQGNADALLSGDGLSSFGQSVAAFTAQSGSIGCAVAALSLPITVPSSLSINASNSEITSAANTSDPTSGPSIADVAALASKGLDASGQTINTTALLATTGIPSAALASDEVGAPPGSGLGLTQWAQPLAVNAPGGTMSAPDPVSNSTTFTASGRYQTVVPDPGNAMGTVSGIGNTIDAIGGIQTITVTGSGNTISTGPYNDIITVQTAGNTIDSGGGNDTVILAYGGKAPATTVNADAAALAPLASAGNIIVVPAPGMGTVTIQGVLAENDRIDLTHALAGTTWNGSAATIWNYVTASTSSQGCTISVGGKTIVTLPNGSPSGNIGSFITAHSPT